MQVNLQSRINYLNEALILATYICNTDPSNDSVLPIDYKKITFSKLEIDRKYQWLVSFLSVVRAEARVLLDSHSELKILFQRCDNECVPEILNFLTFSNLKQSIEYYSQNELLDKIKKSFIINMESLGFTNTTSFSFDELDRMTIFNEQQRYMIYKLLNNINDTYDIFYKFLSSMESIFKSRDKILIEELGIFYNSIKGVDILSLDSTDALNNIIENHKLDNLEYTFFIQFPQPIGFTLSIEDQLTGFLFIGFLPFLLRENSISVEENKNEMASKFLALSDPTRFNIIILLSKGSMYGREIAEKLTISTGTISHHLSLLVKEGILESEAKGKRIYYKINQIEFDRMSQFINHIGGRGNEK